VVFIFPQGKENINSGFVLLAGESRFPQVPPLGIEPGSVMAGSKQVDTGPVELCVNAMRLQALHRAPPQQPAMSVVKLKGGHAASVKSD
jgi:hypothetical protein